MGSIWNLLKVGLLLFSIVAFNLAMRIAEIIAMHRAAGSGNSIPLPLLEALLIILDLTVILALYAILRLFKARHLWVMLLVASLGICASLAIALWTKYISWIVFVIYILPQMPVYLTENRRPEE
jgi:hypothetical protein